MSQYTPPNDASGQQGGYEGTSGYDQQRGYDQRGQYERTGTYGDQSGGYGGGQYDQSGQYGTTHRARPLAEMEVSQPTLRWVSISSPDQTLPLGEDDYVLDSFFDVRYNSWEVLVLVQPTESEMEDEGEEE